MPNYFGEPWFQLTLCRSAFANFEVPLFSNLSGKCRPEAVRSYRCCTDNCKLEINIEPSDSPWRGHVLITINKFSMIDTFPLPEIEDIVEEKSIKILNIQFNSSS
ncbi:hypothetical protein JTB14_026445 [Gonioctena quinquepunctata]|nr:hypothetical protein JTB14_026445 [Gonioctena quinquepunctata]